jgi:hypothetical protein
MVNRLMREAPENIASLWPDLPYAALSEAEITDALHAVVANHGLSDN